MEQLRHKTEDDKERGLYRKYVALRWPSAEPIRDFFLLRVDQDPFALPAVRAYAEACREIYPRLAADLIQWAGEAEARMLRKEANVKRIDELEASGKLGVEETENDR